MRVTLQGGPGSWSEESLRSLLPHARPVLCQTAHDAWRRCKAGQAGAAWLAASNTTVGEVAATRAARAEGRVLARLAYPVRHALLARSGAGLERLCRIEAHPLALAQCRRALDALVPHAERVATVDGAWSAFRLRGRDDVGVLASARVAPRAGLAVLRPDVADEADNATTFELLACADPS